ncbi:MAG: 50S ribosomal protein L32 [Puniceicoccales bacterium]|jgi:large subunit ribosomal protein L32|nr:50S ribosomal protein L32 [Puniceicoccales bacterium]
MAVPKRKQSKQRSRKRRGANHFAMPQFAKDPNDGSTFLPHHIHPKTGMYRGRQVIDMEAN